MCFQHCELKTLKPYKDKHIHRLGHDRKSNSSRAARIVPLTTGAGTITDALSLFKYRMSLSERIWNSGNGNKASLCFKTRIDARGARSKRSTLHHEVRALPGQFSCALRNILFLTLGTHVHKAKHKSCNGTSQFLKYLRRSSGEAFTRRKRDLSHNAATNDDDVDSFCSV